MKPILLCSILVLSGSAFWSQLAVAQTADDTEVTADDAEVIVDDAESIADDAEVTQDGTEVAVDDAEVVTDSGFSREEVLLASLSIFVLAIFVGFEVITKVPPTLHTPLMSGSNAISGITVVVRCWRPGSESRTRPAWSAPWRSSWPRSTSWAVSS